MRYIFDKTKLEGILQQSDWYVQLGDIVTEFFIRTHQFPTRDAIPKQWLVFRTQFIDLVSDMLQRKTVSLANEGPDLDKERRAIDALVVHHSSNTPDYGFEYLNAMCLLRLYVKHYLDKNGPQYGKPIWSNHFINGEQIFVPYHYLVTPDGRLQEALPLKCVGWHCGDRLWNARSVGVCFLGDLENGEPTQFAISAVRSLISKLKPAHVLGHREIKKETICPGNRFLGNNGWKRKLLDT